MYFVLQRTWGLPLSVLLVRHGMRFSPSS
jgi:hypothetical protein